MKVDFRTCKLHSQEQYESSFQNIQLSTHFQDQHEVDFQNIQIKHSQDQDES